VLLLDVTPISLGIAIHGGGFDKIIERNTTVPVRQSRVFTTSRDNQTTLKVIVMQGEGEKAVENDLLGEFTLSGLRAARAGELDIEITFDIDADGIVKVTGKDLQTGNAQTISVVAASQLSEDEVLSMMAEHQDYLLDARHGDALDELREELRQLIRDGERLLPQAEAAACASLAGQDALQAGQRALDEARAALQAREVERAQSARDKMRAALSKLHRLTP
jgi:molecular chaperone DnaK